MKQTLTFLFSVAILFSSCGKLSTEKTLNGRWHAEFIINEKQIPFVFDIHHLDTDSATAYLINGAERVELKGISKLGDTLTIPIEAYDAMLVATIDGLKMKGRFIKNFLDNDSGIFFEATRSDSVPRFAPISSPVNISPAGKWDVLFIDEKGDTTRNVGIFALENNILTGSILTKTGDLRFLEGAMTSEGFQLSAFAGLSPYLIETKFEDKDNFKGKFYTTRGKTQLVGKRNDEANPIDPYSLTALKKGYKSIDFTFPNIDGDMVSLKDSKYRGKVVILSILGSWCPNCLDEMDYLSPWYDENKDRGVEVLGIAFERKDDTEYAKKVLSRLRDRYNVKYEILFAGKVGTESTEKALPALTKVMSYPTTIFIDKKGIVRKIHTGFNGPATGLFFDDLKTKFNALVDNLLAEE
ncbi:peroxiredoxin [Dysgonomonas sp. 520]|uniref:peroxiredoxin family protein n=1 Tax=Dysgonomonas sp. 520 TaxID=2302931 RepID=UPI0013D5F8A6|nr:TlpA disulfide reductase family protein [Dysgonomonas sp. 520]NDW09454.1 TlpA family protein disulfide reductase [Dysgonomonas sp. 520]